MRHQRSSQKAAKPDQEKTGLPLPLSELTGGEKGIVCELIGGREFTNRIATLGFTIGAPVSVIRNMGHGPIIISVLDTHIALGRLEASNIQVFRP
jgi:Fe2+ transport system protein FeoA